MTVTPRRVVAALSLAIFLSGCATVGRIQYALEATPTRAQEMWEDPIRRAHFATEASLQLGALGVTIACAVAFGPTTLLGLLGCPVLGVLTHFGVYEFVLEPLSKERVQNGEPSLVGPYWERGPQTGETFIRP